ncbi:hypothetical protein SLS56_009736 [Neofusicoccum ribis]|uniref:Solute carrier family 40 member n=1 Tax=Neofusicoccum ribis TaxID=45134 RepID=A0ABR3SGF9_9PEZI
MSSAHLCQVYQIVPQLGEPRSPSAIQRAESYEGGDARSWKHLLVVVREELHELGDYFHHKAFLPSFSSALLNLTALSFSGQMITYLVSVGWDSILVGTARSISVAFELSATWITPKVNKRIGPLRSAIWFISWQMLCLAAGTSAFWIIDKPLPSASGLVVGAILSRVGMWGFSMSTQAIIQELLAPGS